MIVHLFEDEKFVDDVINNFDNESVNGFNKYIIFSNSKQLKHVSLTKKVVLLPKSSFGLDLDLIFKDCQLLVIHYLTPIKMYILKNKPPNVKALWSIWGSDAYDFFNNQDFFEPLTQKIRKNNIYQQLRFSRLYKLYHFLKYKVNTFRDELETLNKIHFISTVLPYEYKIIIKEFNLSAKYIEYNYFVDKFDDTSLVTLGKSILVGNSATFSNNHLDIFEIIKNNRTNVITPLSYGALGYKKYRKKVIKRGKKLFKENFIPLDSFLPSRDYNTLLVTCNTMIMFHVRQQALGNIYMALFLGIRVFLNKRSLTFKYLNDVGIVVFDLEKDFDSVGIELSNKQKEINKKLVISLQGQEAIKKKTKGIIELAQTF